MRKQHVHPQPNQAKTTTKAPILDHTQSPHEHNRDKHITQIQPPTQQQETTEESTTITATVSKKKKTHSELAASQNQLKRLTDTNNI